MSINLLMARAMMSCKRSKHSLPSEEADVSPAKARKILADGQVQGKPLTDKQRGMFGAIAGDAEDYEFDESKHPRDEGGEFTLSNKPKKKPPKFKTTGAGKQGALFGKSGKAGQMNLFADTAVPDELLPKEQRTPGELFAMHATLIADVLKYARKATEGQKGLGGLKSDVPRQGRFVWRTIGGDKGAPEGTKGGTPVLIDVENGTIKGGPKALEGKSLKSLDKNVAGTAQDKRKQAIPPGKRGKPATKPRATVQDENLKRAEAFIKRRAKQLKLDEASSDEAQKIVGKLQKDRRALVAGVKNGSLTQDQADTLDDKLAELQQQARAKAKGAGGFGPEGGATPAKPEPPAPKPDDTPELGKPASDQMQDDIKDHLAKAGGPVRLDDLRQALGQTDVDPQNPLANPVHRALKELRDSGEVQVSKPQWGEPSASIGAKQPEEEKPTEPEAAEPPQDAPETPEPTPEAPATPETAPAAAQEPTTENPATVSARGSTFEVAKDQGQWRFRKAGTKGWVTASDEAAAMIEEQLGLGGSASPKPSLEEESKAARERARAERRKEYSDQEISERDYARNFNEVMGDVDAASDKDLIRARGYANSFQRHLQRQLKRGEISQEQFDHHFDSLQSEIDNIGRILKGREAGDLPPGPEFRNRAQKIADKALADRANVWNVAKEMGLTRQEIKRLMPEIQKAMEAGQKKAKPQPATGARARAQEKAKQARGKETAEGRPKPKRKRDPYGRSLTPRLRNEIAEAIESTDPNHIQDFHQAMVAIHKQMTDLAEARNDAMRQLLSQFGLENKSHLSGFQKSVRAALGKGHDADRIQRDAQARMRTQPGPVNSALAKLDQMVEMAEKRPELMQTPTAGAGGISSPESQLLDQVNQGYQRPPAFNSDEVWDATFQSLGGGAGFSSPGASETPAEEEIPFSLAAAKRSRYWQLIRYRLLQNAAQLYRT